MDKQLKCVAYPQIYKAKSFKKLTQKSYSVGQPHRIVQKAV